MIKKDLKKNINYDNLKTMISKFSLKLDKYKSTQFINTGIIKNMHKTINGDTIVVQIVLILLPEFMPKRPCKYTSYNKKAVNKRFAD